MEDWTEENLRKLTVKELKSLARKSNVNPNYKKAELVNALLTTKDTVEENETAGEHKSKRMTRSRVSMWQTNETAVTVKETTAKYKEEDANLDAAVKFPIEKKQVKKRKVKEVENIDSYNTTEMFPLVSSIQLAAKPLIEITNKDVKQIQDKVQSPPRSKRSKRVMGLDKSLENSSPPNNIELTKAVPEVGLNPPQLPKNDQQKDTDLNSTSEVEEEKTIPKYVKKTSKKSKQVENVQANEKQKKVNKSKQLDENPIVYESYDEAEGSKGNTEDLASVDNKETKKPKRGKKRKSVDNKITAIASIQQESSETCSLGVNSQGHSKGLRKKGKKPNEGNEIIPNNDTSQIIIKPPMEQTSEGTHELSDSTVNETKNISTSSNTKHQSSKKRKFSNSPVKENLNNEFGSKSPESPHNKSKRRKGTRPIEINVNSKEIKADRKQKAGKTRKHESPVEEESSKTQDFRTSVSLQTKLNNSSGSLRSFKRSLSPSTFQNESTDSNCKDSFENISTLQYNNSKENTLDNKDTSTSKGETGRQSTQAPIRSSTFILSDSVTDQETALTEEMPPVLALTRNATFTLSDSDGKNSPRKSFRFSPKPGFKANPAACQSSGNVGKSIGHRIMQSSAVKRKAEKSTSKAQGSTLKKNLAKNSTPGSVFKKRPTSKMPDFKKIHQHLFKNMESLSENKKRQQNRAQVLLMSPAVPRCALLSPKLSNGQTANRSPMKKVQNAARTSLAPSPLAAKLKTPVSTRTSMTAKKSATAVTGRLLVPPKTFATTSRTPLVERKPSQAGSRTPLGDRKPDVAASSVNRFGYRKLVKKEEAKRIMGKTLPLANLENRKEQERNVLKGVRMNKRFMLQMQMRQMEKDLK